MKCLDGQERGEGGALYRVSKLRLRYIASRSHFILNRQFAKLEQNFLLCTPPSHFAIKIYELIGYLT
jgi:hypothetical protein